MRDAEIKRVRAGRWVASMGVGAVMINTSNDPSLALSEVSSGLVAEFSGCAEHYRV